MISAVVLTKNNGKTLDAVLGSLSWCDEIVLVDDLSRDDTTTIAKSHHARVYKRALDGDFAGQRNFGLSKAKGDWVLFIDSDELVSDELRDEIQKTIQYTHCSGYMLKRDDYIFGKKLKYGETGSVRLLRLAKKTAGVWVRRVHEVWDVRGQTGELSQPIMHYPHSDVAQFLQDINDYTSLNARYLYEQNVSEPVWYIVMYPLAKFLRNYIFLGGFLDGIPGAILAIMMSFHSFLTRSKLFILRHKTDSNSGM